VQRKVAIAETGKGFFVGSTQRKNKKGSGAIQFAFRRSWLAKRRLGKTRPREAEEQTRHSTKCASCTGSQ